MINYQNPKKNQLVLYAKAPPDYYNLRRHFAPICEQLLHARAVLNGHVPPRVFVTLERMSFALLEIIDDDELGLLNAYPERRVCALHGRLSK